MMVMNTSKRTFNILPWLVWGLGAAFFFTQYLARVVPSVLTVQLAHTFSANAFTLGSLSAFFYYAYVPMQIPAGILVDRFGSVKLLIMATLIAACGCLLFAVTTNIYLAELSRFLIGFGGAFGFVCTIKIASLWFPKKYFGFLTSITQASGMLGAICGTVIISLLVEKMPWQNAIIIISIMFAAIGFAIFFITKKFSYAAKKRCRAAQIHTQITKQKTSIIRSFRTVMQNPQSWFNVIYVAALYAPIAAFCEFWGTSYLHNVYNVSVKHAAFGVSLVFLGWLIGAPLMGYISDKIGRRRPVMIASAFGSLTFLGLILYSPNLPLIDIFIFLFLLGMANAGVAISYAIAGEMNPSFASGTSIALANMASVALGSLAQPLIGWLLDARWSGNIANGMHHYSPENFRSAMSILFIFMTIACVAVFFIKETFCQNVDSIEIIEKIPLTNDTIPAINEPCYSEVSND